jgi:hypothetical protein
MRVGCSDEVSDGWRRFGQGSYSMFRRPPRSLGLTTCRAFWSCGEALTVVGRTRPIRTERGFEDHWLPTPPRHGSGVSPGRVIISLQSIRPRGPNTTRTDVCTCFCMQGTNSEHANTFLIRYRSGGTPDEPCSPVIRQYLGH